MEFDETLIAEWVSFMFSKGYTYKTVIHYVNILSALYSRSAKDEGIAINDSFSKIKNRLGEASQVSSIDQIPDCFNKLRHLVLSDYSMSTSCQLAKDIVLFSLYNGGLTFDSIAKFRKDAYSGTDEAILSIVARYSKPKNKYLFPLHQSAQTHRQINNTIASLFSEALRSVGIEIPVCNNDTAAGLWGRIAMQCGFSIADAAACLGPSGNANPLYSFARKKVLTTEQIIGIRNRVSQLLSRDSEDWYAMRFRPYVNYDKVLARLNSIGISFSKSFYPMEEIVQRLGKKMKHGTRPVIPGLFFFKCKATHLQSLFHQIGDLAWGYRSSREARSPFAVIPAKSIEDYQKAVGKFIDAIDANPNGTMAIEPGDKVQIIGGDYAGHPAILQKEIHDIEGASKPVTKITYRLSLAGIEQYTWTVELDPRQVIKVTDKQFDNLRKAVKTSTLPD